MVNDAIGRYSVEELHDRVSVLEPGILLMREIADGDAVAISADGEGLRFNGKALSSKAA